MWREGHELREFGVPGARDYTMGCLWSPDNRRLLVRFGSSGASDVDAGSVFCLKLGRGKSYQYHFISAAVRKMQWRDNRTVLHWPLNYETGTVPEKPRVWRVP